MRKRFRYLFEKVKEEIGFLVCKNLTLPTTTICWLSYIRVSPPISGKRNKNMRNSFGLLHFCEKKYYLTDDVENLSANNILKIQVRSIFFYSIISRTLSISQCQCGSMSKSSSYKVMFKIHRNEITKLSGAT